MCALRCSINSQSLCLWQWSLQVALRSLLSKSRGMFYLSQQFSPNVTFSCHLILYLYFILASSQIHGFSQDRPRTQSCFLLSRARITAMCAIMARHLRGWFPFVFFWTGSYFVASAFLMLQNA